MLHSQYPGMLVSSVFFDIPKLMHGFTTRRLGDMRDRDIYNRALTRSGLSPSRAVFPEQIHGNRIVVVGDNWIGQQGDGADGVVCRIHEDSPYIISVITADCVPILAVDPVHKVIGAAHAGWRGTYGQIAKELISGMREAGATTPHIRVALGPHIGACCYKVDANRAQLFMRQDTISDAIIERSDQHYIDLACANARQLGACGIDAASIDAHPTCTSCQNETFFSYRADTKATFGENMSFITFV